MYAIRAAFFLINVVVLLMGWTVIVVINLYTTDIRDFLSSLPGIVFISQFVPNLILAFINALVPFMTKKITVCERYDFQADLLK